MHISNDELEAMEPMHVACTDAELVVTLANGQKVVTPLWWYPRSARRRRQSSGRTSSCPLFGVHWPDVDEDLSIEGMLVGSKAPGAREPEPA